MKIIGIIPARMASSRLPGKPLAKILGRPMIEHVYRRSLGSQMLSKLYIATCDKEIEYFCKLHQFPCIMTSDEHRGCIDRAGEAIDKIGGADVVVIIQGDEPLILPEMIDIAIHELIKDPDVHVVNMTCPTTDEEQKDQNEVKVVLDDSYNALYFSRADVPDPIRAEREGGTRQGHKQICIIPIEYAFLKMFINMEPTPLEKYESVDMLRFLENGIGVRMVPTKSGQVYSVDTEEDRARVEIIMKNDEVYKRLFT